MTFASYACNATMTKGRLYAEQPTPYRNEFARDRDRVIHSNAFRRLQYKTQVFVNHKGDHYRNRLTHSIEVSTIARSIANALSLSDDLAEVVALAHDLGHTPFGHAGEEALNACMSNHGGFSHNTHSLKILTKLEQCYGAYDGLNLTWEVLEGIVKHNGPLANKDIDSYITEYDTLNTLDLCNYSSAEAQVASLSDDIAYISHDLEDSIRAGILDFHDLAEIPMLDTFINEVQEKFSTISSSRLSYEVVRKLMHYLVNSLLQQTRINLHKYNIQTVTDVRKLGTQLVEFTPETTQVIKQIKNMLLVKVFQYPKITAETLKCNTIITELFALYTYNIKLLPPSWQAFIDSQHDRYQVVADYLAGMTDRFAIHQHNKHFNLSLNNVM